MNVTVNIQAPVNPTEMQEKVEKSILNFFQVDLKIRESEIPVLSGYGDLNSLRMLHARLREERILDTARNILLRGIDDSKIRFLLNKQVAYAGKLNFPPGEEILGSIHVEIHAQNPDDIEKLIDWLAPQTIDGKPVREILL